MTSKKVLFLSPLPPPNYGSALSSQEILNFLKKSRQFEIKNIKLNYSQEISDTGKINLNKIRGISIVRRQIRDSINSFDPHIVYLMPATDNLGAIRDWLFFRQIRKLTNKKIIFHIRTRLPDKNWKNPIFKKIYMDILTDKKSYFIILGNELIPDLKGLVLKDKIFILPNAIKNEINDKELKKIIKSRSKIKPTNILFLSNMDKTKGWPKLLQACKILNKKGLKFHCYFAGAWTNKQDEKMFFNYVKKNNLSDKVFYIGRLEGKDKWEILKKPHILAFPTEYALETFGRVIVEAMMFSTPVVANSIAIIPFIVQDGKTGFLLRENTPEEIADYLEKLIKNPKLSHKLGLAGRKRFLREFEIRNYSKKFIKILNNIPT